MISPSELAADITYGLSVWLAARNSVHTWWTGIVGCALFAWVFFHTQLYADVTLQGFYIVTSLMGWWHWLHGKNGGQLPVRRTDRWTCVLATVAALLVAAGYGALLHRFTNAYAPFVDSLVLTFSVLGQLLLMGRRVENWYVWLVVDAIAVPLYISRELYLTAGLYAIFWFNAWYGLFSWRRELAR
ncbi:nicotinamide mononucleotide transporter [Chitinimonas arctica]|uniref:Nicotinamide riboside transporter PnuC n=2 Tax=Chitinimonas arctica TaxID=2594795 RepID=A0A516SMC1_9NEIS|nr:nicotinamide mononucleotide transporter [Chitinimonas arctica]